MNTAAALLTSLNTTFDVGPYQDLRKNTKKRISFKLREPIITIQEIGFYIVENWVFVKYYKSC